MPLILGLSAGAAIGAVEYTPPQRLAELLVYAGSGVSPSGGRAANWVSALTKVDSASGPQAMSKLF